MIHCIIGAVTAVLCSVCTHMEDRARLVLIAEDIAREARLASIALAEAITREQHEPERDLVVFTYLQLCYTSRRPASRRLPRAVALCYSQQLQQNVDIQRVASDIQRKRRDSAARRKGVRLHARKHACTIAASESATALLTRFTTEELSHTDTTHPSRLFGAHFTFSMTRTCALRTCATYFTPTSWLSCCAGYQHQKSPRCPSSLLLRLSSLLLLLRSCVQLSEPV